MIPVAFSIGGAYYQQARNLAETQAELMGHVERDEIVHNAQVLADDQGTIIDWQPGMEEQLGWEADEIIGRPIDVIIDERFQDRHNRAYAKAIAEAPANLIHYIPCHAKHKDGSSVPVTIRVRLREHDNGLRYAVADFDVNAKMLRPAEQAYQDPDL